MVGSRVAFSARRAGCASEHRSDMKHAFFLPLLWAAVCTLPLSAAPAEEPADETAAGEVPPFLAAMFTRMNEDVETAIRTYTTALKEHPEYAQELRGIAAAYAEAATRYYEAQVQMGRLLTSHADEATKERFEAAVRALAERDFRYVAATTDWRNTCQEPPAPTWEAPMLMQAVPVLSHGRTGHTLEIGFQAAVVADLWQQYVAAGYHCLQKMFSGEYPYPLNIHTGYSWESDEECHAVSKQFEKVYAAWQEYCKAFVNAAVPGHECNLFWGTGIPCFASEAKARACASFEEFMLLMLNPDFSDEE